MFKKKSGKLVNKVILGMTSQVMFIMRSQAFLLNENLLLRKFRYFKTLPCNLKSKQTNKYFDQN